MSLGKSELIIIRYLRHTSVIPGLEFAGHSLHWGTVQRGLRIGVQSLQLQLPEGEKKTSNGCLCICADYRQCWPSGTPRQYCLMVTFREHNLIVLNARPLLCVTTIYTLLAAAIRRHQETGQLYETVQLAKEAAGGLGYESINERVVRLWHAEYLAGNGTLKADGRGYYTREILILEEDLKNKFTRWCLRSAKKDDLSIDAVLDYLNDDLLPSLPASTLVEYKMKLPISYATTWRWMRECGIHRDI